mgnify:CR=1 FL=1
MKKEIAERITECGNGRKQLPILQCLLWLTTKKIFVWQVLFIWKISS